MARRGIRATPADERAPVQCDEVDRRLIELLVADVRASNRELAEAAGVSAQTVATRLARLREANLLAATVVVDWWRAGFRTTGFVFARVAGDGLGAADAFVGHPNVQSVVRSVGFADVVVNVIAETPRRLREVVDEIADGPGVLGIEVQFVIEYHRIHLQRVILPMIAWSPADLPAPEIPLDEIDRRLIECLAEDGHRSNREVGRRLEVSEATVRARLRRLEDSGLVRVLAMANPFALGEATPAYFILRTAGGPRAKLVDEIARRPEVAALATCVGGVDVVGLLVDRSQEEILLRANEIRSLPGVRSIETAQIVDSPFHRAYLSRLLPAGPNGYA